MNDKPEFFLTTEDINARIESIKQMAGDDEVAHGEEDKLYADFIKHVRLYPTDEFLTEKAKLVLMTGEIHFERWCA